MNRAKSRQIVLVLDEDLGFVMWVGQVLSAAGMIPVPARSCSEAKGRLREFNLQPDLAVVNPTLPGALEFIHEIEASAIVYTIDVPAAGARGVMTRYSGNKPSAETWVTKVKRALAGE